MLLIKHLSNTWFCAYIISLFSFSFVFHDKTKKKWPSYALKKYFFYKTILKVALDGKDFQLYEWRASWENLAIFQIIFCRKFLFLIILTKSNHFIYIPKFFRTRTRRAKIACCVSSLIPQNAQNNTIYICLLVKSHPSSCGEVFSNRLEGFASLILERSRIFLPFQ